MKSVDKPERFIVSFLDRHRSLPRRAIMLSETVDLVLPLDVSRDARSLGGRRRTSSWAEPGSSRGWVATKPLLSIR